MNNILISDYLRKRSLQGFSFTTKTCADGTKVIRIFRILNKKNKARATSREIVATRFLPFNNEQEFIYWADTKINSFLKQQCIESEDNNYD